MQSFGNNVFSQNNNVQLMDSEDDWMPAFVAGNTKLCSGESRLDVETEEGVFETGFLSKALRSGTVLLLEGDPPTWEGNSFAPSFAKTLSSCSDALLALLLSAASPKRSSLAYGEAAAGRASRLSSRFKRWILGV